MSAKYPLPAWELRKAMKARGWYGYDLANRTGLSQSQVSDILTGKKKITPRVALLLEEAFGEPAMQWLHLQNTYDLDQARKKWKLNTETPIT